jgi:hypothetical protein
LNPGINGCNSNARHTPRPYYISVELSDDDVKVSVLGPDGERDTFFPLLLELVVAEKSGLDQAGERHGFFSVLPSDTAVELDICGQKLDARHGWRSTCPVAVASPVQVLMGGGRFEKADAFCVLSRSTVDVLSSLGHHPEVEHKFLPVSCTKLAT